MLVHHYSNINHSINQHETVYYSFELHWFSKISLNLSTFVRTLINLRLQVLAGPGGPPPQECFKPQPNAFPGCCKIVLLPPNVVASCKQSNPPPAEPPTGPPSGCCYSDCIFNATGIMANGQFDKNAALKLVGSLNNNDATINSVVSAAIDDCTSKISSMPPPPPATAPGTCGMASGFMKGCVTRGVFANCPANLKQSNADCDAVKALTDKCPIIVN